MPRPDSVQPVAAPLRHPHWKTARDDQAEAFRAEIRAYVKVADEMRARIAAARVLETVQ